MLVFVAALAGLTIYVGMYVFVCLGISVAAYFACFAVSRWRNPPFWMIAIVFASIAGAMSAPRILPMLADQPSFEDALRKDVGGERSSQITSGCASIMRLMSVTQHFF